MVALEVEAWIWYGVTILVVVARFTARYLQLKSVKKFQLEDFIMFCVTILYTGDIILLLKMYNQNTNLIPAEDLATLLSKDPADRADEIADRVFGSKLIIVLEQIFCATQWGCKTCLLLLYANLTIGLRQHLMVKIVAVYTAAGYIIMQILYFGVWCRPFSDYWSVPAANPQCATYINHLIVNFVVNVSSDLLILMIPLPMLIRTKLPIRKKLILCCVFSVGIFVIASAILNKYSSFKHPYLNLWAYWYTREGSTAVIVANLPHGWALLRRAFKLRSFMHSEDSENSLFITGNRNTGTGGSTMGTMRPISFTRGRRESAMSEITRTIHSMRNKPRFPNDIESIEALGSRPTDCCSVDMWEKKRFTFGARMNESTQIEEVREESPSGGLDSRVGKGKLDDIIVEDIREVKETPAASPSGSVGPGPIY